jgi:hypothetical protein
MHFSHSLKLYPPREYLRPWKLFSLAVGFGLLIVGAFYYRAPDWDVPIRLIMASLTYLSAPWALRVLLTRQWRLWPAALFVTWFSVDGCYWIYWSYKDPVALAEMRSANFPASLSLYFICGVIWLYRGSLREFLTDLRLAWKARRS